MQQPTHAVEIDDVTLELPIGKSYQVNRDSRQSYRRNLRAMQQYSGGITARVVRHLLQEGISQAEEDWYGRVLAYYSETELSKALLSYRLQLLRKTPRLESVPDYFSAFLCGTNPQKTGQLPSRYATRFERVIAGTKRRKMHRLANYLQDLKKTTVHPDEL